MWAALGKAAVGMAKKKVKKKGAEMAKNIVNKKEKDNSSAIVVREKSASIVQSPGGALVKQDQDSSIQKPKSGSSPLDRIDSALLDIINTLKSRRKLMLAQSRRDRVQSNKEKKGKREGLLKKMKAGGKKMLGNIKAAASGWWERLQTFLLMTMLGALVLAIKNNWKAIQEQIEKVVKFVQNIWKFMSPVLIPLYEGLKWVVKQWTEMGSALMEATKDNSKIEKETDQITKDLNGLEKAKKDVDGKFKEAEQGVRDLEHKTFDDLAIEAGLNDKVSPDNEEQPDATAETDTKVKSIEEKTVKGTSKATEDSDIKDKKEALYTKLADAEERLKKYEDEGDHASIEGVEMRIKHYKSQIEKMEKYETGAFPVPETGPAIVHKGEVIIPAPVVKQFGGAMKIEKFIWPGKGLGGGGGGTNALTENAKVKNLAGHLRNIIQLGSDTKRVKSHKDKDYPVELELGIAISEYKRNFDMLNEQTDYENPLPNTIIVPLPAPSQPPSGGGGGSEGGTKVITIQTDSLNRYMQTLIQGALY